MIELLPEELERAATAVMTSIRVILMEVVRHPERFGYAHVPDARERALDLIDQSTDCRLAIRMNSDLSRFEQVLENFTQFYRLAILDDK